MSHKTNIASHESETPPNGAGLLHDIGPAGLTPPIINGVVLTSEDREVYPN